MDAGNNLVYIPMQFGQKENASALVLRLRGVLPSRRLTAKHRIALVGSWARGEADRASDVDILFVGFDAEELQLAAEIVDRLNIVAPASVDAIKAERLPDNVLRSLLGDAIYLWPE